MLTVKSFDFHMQVLVSEGFRKRRYLIFLVDSFLDDVSAVLFND
jgi:hypothetical protein